MAYALLLSVQIFRKEVLWRVKVIPVPVGTTKPTGFRASYAGGSTFVSARVSQGDQRAAAAIVQEPNAVCLTSATAQHNWVASRNLDQAPLGLAERFQHL